MKTLYFLSFISWIAYIFFSYISGEGSSSGGGALGDYMQAKDNFNFFAISMIIFLFAIIMNIVIMASSKIKGVNGYAIVNLILSVALVFWTFIMLTSKGVDLDEIYYGLMGIAAVIALFSLLAYVKVKKAA